MKRIIIFIFLVNCFIGKGILNEVTASYVEDEDKELQEENLHNLLIEGFVFKDINHSGHMDKSERISQLKINLWQEDNLMDTTLTDEEGYYCFEDLQKNQKYQITVECFSDCTLMKKCLDDDITNDFTIMQDYQVKTEVFVMDKTVIQYNLGLTPIAYHIDYQLNGGIGSFQKDEKAYAENEKVKVLSATYLEKKGYIFEGWSTKKNGNGEIYQANQIITMPSHNMTLYAIWKKDISSADYSQTNSIQKVKQSNIVETSDEYNTTSILLILLSSVGGILVTKSLKKNR